MADSKHYYGGLHGVPWQDLNPRFMNDKTPPGWYVGCDLDLERYELLCEDWKRILERYAMEPSRLGQSSAIASHDFRMTMPEEPPEVLAALRDLKFELRLVIEYTNYAVHVSSTGAMRKEKHSFPAIGESGLDMKRPLTLGPTGVGGMRSRGFHMRPYQS